METWRKAVEVFDAEAGGSQTLALFPEDRCEWRLHREWFGKSAMADLLGADFGLAETHKSIPATACCSPTRTRCSHI